MAQTFSCFRVVSGSRFLGIGGAPGWFEVSGVFRVDGIGNWFSLGLGFRVVQGCGSFGVCGLGCKAHLQVQV